MGSSYLSETLLPRITAWTGLGGLDLDVAEAILLPLIISLIDRLKLDIGRSFFITLAPVPAAMQSQQNLLDLDYRLLNKAFARNTA